MSADDKPEPYAVPIPETSRQLGGKSKAAI
jgi:hypothetical protein